MSNDVKTYQIFFNITAKDKNEAILKAKLFIETSPDKAIKEIGNNEKYRIIKV